MTISRTVLNSWTILAIDDEPDSLEVVTRILRFHGASIVTGCNGQEGLELARKVHPHLIISDISMPVLDGWGLIYELKKDRTTLNIPAIALTAHAMPGDRSRAISAGFHNYLTKPLTAKSFMSDLLILLLEMPEFSALTKGVINE